MRVTNNSLANALVAQLTRLSARQYQLQRQISSGQRISLPEDDPAATRRVLNLQSEAKAVGQYQRNAAVLGDLAKTQYQALRGLHHVLDRAGELATLADDTKSPDELKIYAVELTQLIKQAVQLSETRFRDHHIFSGTLSDRSPFAVNTDDQGQVTSVVYQGNTSLPENEISEGITLSVHVAGANATGSGPRGLIRDDRFGADLFNHLISLQDALKSGDTAAIADSVRPALEKDESNLLYHLGNNAAVQARLESSQSMLSHRSLTLTAEVSREADADLPETIVRLNQVQLAYQAALQSGAKLLSISLLDYLR